MVSLSLARYPGIAFDNPTAPRCEFGPKNGFQVKGEVDVNFFATPKKSQATSARCAAEPPDASRNSPEPISFFYLSLHSLHLEPAQDNDGNNTIHHICTPMLNRFDWRYIRARLNRPPLSRPCLCLHFNAYLLSSTRMPFPLLTSTFDVDVFHYGYSRNVLPRLQAHMLSWSRVGPTRSRNWNVSVRRTLPGIHPGCRHTLRVFIIEYTFLRDGCKWIDRIHG